MSEEQQISPQRRLQELRAIPDRQRTEAQWDELIELEIMLAPENRVTPVQQDPNGRPSGGPGGQGGPRPAKNRTGRGPRKPTSKRPPRRPSGPPNPSSSS